VQHTSGCITERKERETTQAAKNSSHQLRKWGRLGRKAPSPEAALIWRDSKQQKAPHIN